MHDGGLFERGPFGCELEAEADRDRMWSEAADAQEGRDLPAILAATDCSEVSLHTGEHAVRLARELGVRLVVLYVVDEDLEFHAGIHYGDAVADLVRMGREAAARIADWLHHGLYLGDFAGDRGAASALAGGSSPVG